MIGVLTVGSGRQWESDLVAALDRPGSEMTVVRRCADIPDLLATASTGKAAVTLVDGSVRRLDVEAVSRLRKSGVAVIAVCQKPDEKTSYRLDLIGVDRVVDEDVSAGELVKTAAAAVRVFHDRIEAERTELESPEVGRQGATGVHRGVGSVPWAPTGARSVGVRHSPDPARDTGTVRGKVVAVWGPTGAPGRTTVAMGLADAAAVSGSPTLLVDADVYGGVLANAFGLLDESPGLAGACRLAANGRLTSAELDRLCWAVNANLSLLTGISRPDRWPEVRPSAIPLVLDIARRQAACVIVDCGFSVESDEELSYDTVAPRRNGATLAVLAAADVVIAVGSADPPGMERLVRGLAELADAIPLVRPKVVLNRLRSSAAGFEDAAAAVRRFTGLDAVAALPEDRKACDAAWGSGRTLSEVSPASAVRSALIRLAAIVMPALAAAPHGPARGGLVPGGPVPGAPVPR